MAEYIDRYGRSRSICHRLPALAKLIMAITVVVVGVSIPVELWPIQGVLVGIVFMAHSLARIPLSYLLRRLALFLPMLFVISLALPASQGFQSGWPIMMRILFRSTVAFLTVLWLINVMPFDQLLVTMSRLFVPKVFIAMLAFMYRYAFVLWDELEKMQVARRARTFSGGSLLFRWKTFAQMIGMLLIRAMTRAERVHGAMCARGWDGTVRSLDTQSQPDNSV